MSTVKGFVLENTTGDLYDNAGILQVFLEHSNAELHKNKAMGEPDSWEIIPVEIEKKEETI